MKYTAPFVLAIMLLAVFVRTIPGTRTIDDAFITFRYSRNIVEGQGFVYNPPARVLGTTTPLFTLLMGSMAVLFNGRDFPWYAIAVSAIADAGTAALLFLIARRLTGNQWIGGLLGVLWAIAPMSVTFAVGGMETSLNIFWLVGATWLFLENRHGYMGAFAGLGFLTRIDASIWIGLLFAYQLVERWLKSGDKPFLQRIPWRTWIVFGLILLPWLIFSLLYFGSPFPRSLSAKTVAYIMPPGAALGTFIQMYSTPFFEFETFRSTGAMVGFVVYIALNVLALRYTANHIPRLLPFLVYPWVYIAIFTIANPLIFRWYIAPPMPAWMLGILTGAWVLISTLARRSPVAQRITIGALALLWIGMSLNGWTPRPDHGLQRPAPKMAWHQIELYYQQVATELREKYGVTPETRVASADIGAVGYFSNAIIVDTVGLVTPELSDYYPIPKNLIPEGQNYAIPPELILNEKPAFLITMEAFVRLGLEQTADFKAQYGDPIILIPTGFYGTDMRVYKRIEQ